MGFADPRTPCLSQNERIEHSKEVSSGLDDMPAYGPGRPLPVSDKATQWPHEWTVIKPMLPNKPRGVPRVNDRRVLNGIFRVLRSRAPWRDLPDA